MVILPYQVFSRLILAVSMLNDSELRFFVILHGSCDEGSPIIDNPDNQDITESGQLGAFDIQILGSNRIVPNEIILVQLKSVIGAHD
jgi:hypothetical protein